MADLSPDRNGDGATSQAYGRFVTMPMHTTGVLPVEEQAAKLREMAATARRLANSFPINGDKKLLLKQAVELEAEAKKLDRYEINRVR